MTNQEMTHHLNKRKRFFYICLFFSLLFHILVGSCLYFYQPPEIPNIQKQTTKVRLVEKPLSPKKKLDTYELDPLPTPIKKSKADKIEPKNNERKVDTHRKSNRDQWVEKEQARVGVDAKDETTSLPASTIMPKSSKQKGTTTVISPTTKSESELAIKQRSITVPQPSKTNGILSPKPIAKMPHPQINEKPSDQPIIPLNNLFPDAQSLNRIIQGEHGSKNRIKKRDDIDAGDITWLDLQSGPLASFFRRFNNRIESVWNYPQEAIKDKLQGTVELLIVINKQGELVDVLPINSSGSDILDLQAIEAIYAAAPFGPLSKYYQHEEVKIRAHFTYHFIEEAPKRYIYGRKSPFY